MKLEKTPPWLTKLFEDLAAGLPGERKKMFGSLCNFVGGNLSSGTFASTLFVRLGEKDREALLAIDGAEPFSPMPGRPMREYVTLPRELLDEETVLLGWLRRSADYAATLPAKQPKKKTKKK